MYGLSPARPFQQQRVALSAPSATDRRFVHADGAERVYQLWRGECRTPTLANVRWR